MDSVILFIIQFEPLPNGSYMIGGYFSVDDMIAPFSNSKPVASMNT